MQETKEIAIKIAWHYLGTPYRWRGDDPMAGFDCSGLAVEVLKSVGVLPRVGDWSAESLYELFKKKGGIVSKPSEGCLAFWVSFPGGKIRHVEIMINEMLSIGASGGGSKTLTIDDAVSQNAYIKIRPINFNDPEMFGFVDPFKE